MAQDREWWRSIVNAVNIHVLPPRSMYVCMCICRVYISTYLFTNLCVSLACFLSYIYVLTLMILGAG
jgi:hypothetical protein